MPRSRSRNRAGRRDGRRGRAPRLPDSTVLLDLLAGLDPHSPDEGGEDDLLLLEAFDRAAWSFHAGGAAAYAGPTPLDAALARLRAREWFLFEFELPSGLTGAEEWTVQRQGEPGSAAGRRAVQRFLNGECGVFDVRDVRPDGSMRLVPLAGGEPILARPIDRGLEMLDADGLDLPAFKAGDTVAGRLYWQDDDRAELSAGACLVDPGVRARLLADPPPPSELRSGLGLEALIGADPSALLDRAAAPCFPVLANALLVALADGFFDYRRLWKELEGERDPVGVTRQLLSELSAWTDLEPQMLAWVVAGAWLRRREAAAGRALTPAALSQDRRALDEHVRTALDTPGDPEWPVAAAGAALAIEDDEAVADIAGLEVDEVEWVVDVRADSPAAHAAAPSPAHLPHACAIVEQPIIPVDDLEDALGDLDGDEGEEFEDEIPYAGEDDEWPEEEALAGDEDEVPFGEDDEDGVDGGGPDDDLEVVAEDEPAVLRDVLVPEGEDEAAVALDALVETLRDEARAARPRQIVFRQRALAARLGDTLREAGFDLALRCFDEAVDLALLDVPDPGPQADTGWANGAGGQDASRPARASDAERRDHARLADAARRAEDGLQELSAATDRRDEIALTVTLARPLAFPFTTLEGVEPRVGLIAVRTWVDGVLRVRFHLASPGAGSRLDCRGPAGDLLLEEAEALEVRVGGAGGSLPPPREFGASGLAGDGDSGVVVVPVRARDTRPPALLRGRDLEVMAAVMEAVAAAAGRVAEHGCEEPGEVQARVEPLGDVTVAWRGWA